MSDAIDLQNDSGIVTRLFFCLVALLIALQFRQRAGTMILTSSPSQALQNDREMLL